MRAFAVWKGIEFVAELWWRTRCVGTPVVLDAKEMARVRENFPATARGRSAPRRRRECRSHDVLQLPVPHGTFRPGLCPVVREVALPVVAKARDALVPLPVKSVWGASPNRWEEFLSMVVESMCGRMVRLVCRDRRDVCSTPRDRVDLRGHGLCHLHEMALGRWPGGIRVTA